MLQLCSELLPSGRYKCKINEIEEQRFYCQNFSFAGITVSYLLATPGFEQLLAAERPTARQAGKLQDKSRIAFSLG